MKKLFTIALSLLLSISVFSDNTLLVGDINLSASVDQIGGASITIPIEVPVGVNGMQPNLALVYNSHSGYGVAGWGWGLSGLSTIQRTGNSYYHDDNLKEVTFTNSDNLLLDGERLLLHSGENLTMGSVYRTEHESFNHVEMSSSENNTFYVTSKDGTVSQYLSAGYLLNNSPFEWTIRRMEDTNGNYMTYSYSSFDTYMPHITMIEYTMREDEEGNQTEPLYQIYFYYTTSSYEHNRYIGDFVITQNKLLSRIDIVSNYEDLYSYKLEYNTSTVVPKLTSVKKVAKNGDYYAPTTIVWSSPNTKEQKSTSLNTNRKSQYLLGDFNGDGLKDIFSFDPNSTSAMIHYNNTTNGVLSYNAISYTLPYNFVKLKAGDYNGDGRTDLIGIYSSNSEYRLTYLLSNGLIFTSTSDYSVCPSLLYAVGDFDGDGDDEFINQDNSKLYSYGKATVSYPEVFIWGDFYGLVADGERKDNITIDFNADGKTDVFCNPSVVENLFSIMEYNVNTQSFENIIQSNFAAELGIGNFRAKHLRFGDFNADGKTDFIYTNMNATGNYTAYIYHSCGTSFVFDRSIWVYDYRLHIEDFNGDGLSDIAYFYPATDGKWHLRTEINTGNSFVQYDQGGLDISSDDLNMDTNVFFADMYGSGLPNLVYMSGNNTVITKQIYDSSPLLVDKVTDGMGNTFDFTYKSITDDNVYTNTRVGGASVYPLVQPYYVVSDYTAPYTSLSYQYKNGRYHTKGKGFLGFEGLTIKDNLNNTTTNNVNGITTNHLYNYPITTTVKTIDGDTISHLKYRFIVREMGGKRIYPHHSGYDYTDYLTGIKESCVSSYDNNGNLHNQTITRGDWKEISQYQYVNAGSWCPNKVNNSLTYNVYNGGTSAYRRTFYKYNSRGGLVRQTIDTLYTDTYRLVNQYEYDGYGNVTKEIVSGSGQTRTRSYTYSTDGRFLLTSTDELGQTVTNTYDPIWGTLLTQTTNVGTTKNSYDAFGRLCQTIYPDSTVYTISSQFVSDVPSVRYMSHETLTNSSPITTYYNAAGKVLFKKKIGYNNKQIYTAYAYYPNGQEKYVSEPYFSTSISTASSQTFTANNASLYAYDEYQRPYTIENAEGVTLYTYNGLSTTVNTPSVNKETKLSAEGFTEYEQIGPPLLPLVERPPFINHHKKVTYTYYPTGQVKTATPDGGSPITMVYDVQGNRTKIIDPDAGTITNTYNAFGQPLTRSQNIHNGTPVITTYDYNTTTGKLKSETIAGDTTVTTTYSYNSTFKDKLYRVDGSGGYTSYTYDDFGNIKAHQNFYNRKSTRITTYQEKGLVTRHQMSFAGSNNIYYAYDTYGNMSTEKFNSTLAWELLEQNARGQVVRERKGGVVTTYTYDNCGRITSIVAPNIISLHYTYDSSGNVSTKTDYINNQSIEYIYDTQNRLTSWTINDDDIRSVTYDATTGNIISKSDLGESSEFVYDSSAKPHALRGVNNVSTTWGSSDVSIEYTDFGKVKSVQQGNDNYRILYNVNKERAYTQKNVSGTTMTRYYMPNHEVVVNTLGEETYIFYLCNGSIAIHDKAAGTKTLYHGYYDAQGSLIALTDNSGNVIARYAYDPWGGRVNPADWTQSTDTPNYLGIERGYTMHEHLDEFELINMNGRVYDPAVAQFLSPDPYIQDGGNWLNYNRYAYCYNNPTRYVDPDGEFAITSFLVSMAVSAAIDYGMQVFYNFASGMKGKEAWVDNVDFFDVAVSGVFGGVTSGFGAAAIADYSKYIDLGQMVLSSAVSYKGGEWHVSLSHMDLMYGVAINYINKEVSDFLYSEISQHIKDLKLSKSSTKINDNDYANDINSYLGSSLKNEMPYKIEGKINPNDPKIGWRLEGNGIQSFLKGSHRVYYNSRTMEIIKILPVSDTKYKKAIKSFLREHPQYFYMHINKPTG